VVLYLFKKYLIFNSTLKTYYRHSFFKSKEKRNIFDNYQVKPKEGPAPGDYEELKPKNIEITSAFKSDSNRFIKTETVFNRIQV